MRPVDRLVSAALLGRLADVRMMVADDPALLSARNMFGAGAVHAAHYGGQDAVLGSLRNSSMPEPTRPSPPQPGRTVGRHRQTQPSARATSFSPRDWTFPGRRCPGHMTEAVSESSRRYCPRTQRASAANRRL